MSAIAQAKELEARIEAGQVPGFGDFGPRGLGPGGPHGDRGGHLGDAATYLGLSETALRETLVAGKTLGEVAVAQGKTVAGLRAALLASEKEELAQAVEDGRLTQAQADKMLADADERFDDMIAGTMPAHGPGGHGPLGTLPATPSGAAA